MPGNDRVLIENLKKQQLLYTVAEKGAESTELKIIGSMKEALHPEIDGCEGILNAMARPQTAIVSLTVTEKGYCADAASGQLDLNNPLIKHDLENPTAPKLSLIHIYLCSKSGKRETGQRQQAQANGVNQRCCFTKNA